MSSEPRGASAPDLGVLSSTPLAYVAAAAVLVLTVLLAQLTSPLRGAAPVAFDTAATVTYFDRIANRRILETFVPTTPKPLLVFIEGPIWELTHDWRTLTWISVAVFAVGNGLATILGWRLAGAVAGLVTGIALASSSMLTWEALRGLATPWATVGWLVAALAVTARPRRWALAGIALGIAALARVETLAIPAAAGLALVLLTVGPRAVRRPVPRGAWLVLIAFVALPIMLVHDWLLTRNPLYWAQVSGIYSAGIGPSSGRAGVVRALELLVGVFLPYTVVAGLAIVGMVAVARRSALVAFGGVALSIGAIGFILSAGGAGYVLSGRYAAPVVVAMCLGFGVALGLGSGLVAASLRRARSRSPDGARSQAGAAISAGGTIAVAVAVLVATGQIAPLDRSVLKDAATARMLNRAAVLAAKPVRSALADPTLRDAASPRVLVPIGTWPMLALEAGLDLTDVAPFQPSAVDVAAGSPPPGKLILYLRSQDPGRRAAELAVNTRRMIGDVTLVPIVSDAQRGRWLIRLDGPP